MPTAAPLTPARRGFSIRLQPPRWIGVAAIMFIVVGVALPVGLQGYRQHLAIREIELLGGSVVTQPRGPKWLRRWLGDTWLRPIDAVSKIDLQRTRVTDADLARLSHLKGVRVLNLDRTCTTDSGLSQIAEFHDLEFLAIEETLVSDAGLQRLAKLSRLHSIRVFGTSVTKTAVLELEAKLGRKLATADRWDPMWMSCQHCESVYERDGRFWQLIHRSPKFDMCRHLWCPGVSTGVDSPVRDGTVVLVKRDSRYGAFIPRQLNDSWSFTWCYRDDDDGGFDLSDPAVIHGQSVCDGERIKFGCFSIQWSRCGRGLLWVYYDVLPGHAVGNQDMRICVTTETDFTKTDARDHRWVYKGSPADPGVSLPP